MSYKAGTAFVSIEPDMRGFQAKVGAELKGMDADFAKAGDRWGKAASDAFKARFDLAKLPKATIRADADTTVAKAQLDDTAKTRTATIKVKLDTAAEKLGKIPGPGPLGIAGILGGLALGPSAVGAGLLGAGAGLAAGAGAAGIAGFAAIAVPMFKQVTAAQTALTAATKQYDAATTKAGRASALKAEAAATAGLSSSEKQLGAELTSLEGAWNRVQRAEQPLAAKALTSWFVTAKELLPNLPRIVDPAAEAIGQLGVKAERAFQNPFWGKFFTSLGTTGKAAITGFGDAAGHIGDAVAHLFVTFSPDLQKIPGLFDKWSAAFDRWATAEKRSGLDNFLSKVFSKANIASLKTDLGDLATITGNIAKAGAGASPAAFTGLSNLLTILAKLTPTQIEALGIIYGIAKIGGGLASTVGAVTGIVSQLEQFGNWVKGGSKPTSPVPPKPSGEPNDGNTKELPTSADEAAGGASSTLGRITGKLAPYAPAAGPFGIGLLFGAAARASGDKLTPAHTQGGAANQFVQGAGGGGAFGGALSGWAVNGFMNAQRIASKGGHDVAMAFSSGFSGSNAMVAAAFGHAKSWVTGAFHTAGSWLTGTGKSVASGLGSGYTRSAGWVGSQIGKAKGWATGAVRTAGGWLTGAGKSAASGLASGWNRGKSAVTGAVGAAWGWVTGAFGNVGSWLWNAGSSIMDGLLAGLKWGAGKVQGFLNWVSSKIPSWKGPPAVDAVLLRPAGLAVMGSFRDGLSEGLPSVRALAESVAPMVSGAVGLPGVGGAAPAGGAVLQVSTAGGDRLLDALVTALRFEIQGKAGGDVQAHLGRGKART